MTCYSIVAVTPTKEDWIDSYVGPATMLVAKHGGKFLARTAAHEQIEGEKRDAALWIIIEWPTKQAALNFMSDPEYTPHLQRRTAGSKNFHFLVEGEVA
ncbi:DUF1330 domain-containing protein [Flexibacterium corallicola]|uniref:DUF1330 domain-containing protein n=1 Tax=Flexibacterium corallicola TaxID=3037259 RepID=UPI00286F74E1|nr:DUF1330 domain-containing protein [Pseudovibrio sp. M1P-2-3]